MSAHHRRLALATAARLCAVGIVLSNTACASASGPPIDAASRQAVVAAAIAQLDRAYVFPDKARVIGADLRAQLQRGAFDGLDGDALADAMTDAMRKSSHDAHIEVRYMKAAPGPGGAGGPPQGGEDDPAMQRRLNYGFSTVQRLKGNLGYIDVHAFGRPAGAAPRIAAAMGLLAETDALIVDLRHCSGGDPDTVMAFASYLYDQPTHLNDVYWRDENRLERRWTQATVPGQRYGATRPLYLLTSGDTFSGCEDLAYALKNNHRAVLVGETTGGGAHAGSPQRLSDDFMMFVPSGRPINPVTHGDWEGVGVAPDVPVAADKALDTAQLAVLTALAARESDLDWKGKLEERIADLK